MKNLIDLKDTTFIIPILLDSFDRLTNYYLTINYILNNFETNIIVWESDSESHEDLLKIPNVNYIFEKSDNDLFHRTKILNNMTKLAATDIVINYDVDVVFDPNQYVKARNLVKLNKCTACYPYNGNFFTIRKPHFCHVKSNAVDKINLNECELTNSNSFGGAFFFNKQQYTEAGLENENFLSWGFEDNERITRLNTLGFTVGRVNGPLYHLEHKRTVNSGPEQTHYYKNMQEFHKINNMSKSQLTKYIQTWDWANK